MTCIIFENANVFDGQSNELREAHHVAVEGTRIKEVSDVPIKSSSAMRLDCQRKTLMPGMIDNHVHIYFESLNLRPPYPPITYRAQYAQKFMRHMLSCGFTTVRDVGGGDHGMAMALQDQFLEGPRFFYGGLCLTQTGGHGDMRLMSQPTDYCACGSEHNVFAIHADGVHECIKATREELRKGASHIKIMASGGIMSLSDPLERSQYSEEEIRAIVSECTRWGAYVCAHCHPAEAIQRCVDLGVRCIEHGTLIDESTAAAVVKKGAFVVPTLAVIFALIEDGPQLGLQAASRIKLEKLQEKALVGLEAMSKAGVKMGFGTDLMGKQHVRHGTEFTLRNRVLTPLEILRSATSINAEILQMQDKLGVVKQGAFADLLVVDGDPIADIGVIASNGRHITHIMVDGMFRKGSLTN